MANDIFDFVEAKKKQKEAEPDLRQKEIVTALGRLAMKQEEVVQAVTDAIQKIKPPQAKEAAPVSYRFTVNRNSRGFIESIDAEPK